jgi:hypothetical protein
MYITVVHGFLTSEIKNLGPAQQKEGMAEPIPSTIYRNLIIEKILDENLTQN